jgi:arylsulfatase A-like enzyme
MNGGGVAGQPQGTVGRMSESTARYVPYPRPPAGAPNVVMIVLDDIGFAQLGCFGSAIATPSIVRLAGAGHVRPQFCHAVDVFATVLDSAGVPAPDVVDGVQQQPVDGASFAATFTDADAPSPRRTQYFEMHGSRGIYHDGWKATTNYVSPLFGERQHVSGSQDFDDDRWDLFDLVRVSSRRDPWLA